MDSRFFSQRRRGAIVLSLAVLIVTVAGISLWQGLPPVVVLPPITPVASQPASLIDQALPNWPWLWRVRSSIRGTPRPVLFVTTIVDLNGPEGLKQSMLTVPPTYADAHGLRVWIEGAESFEALERSWVTENRARPSFRTSTAHQIGSSQTLKSPSRSSNSGERVFHIEQMPRVSAASVDLTLLVRITEAVTNQLEAASSFRTNLQLVTRLQIPDGKSALLLSENAPPNGESYAILVSTKIGQPKK